MKKLLLAGVTDQTIDIFIQDSSSTTGAGLTGLTDASSGLDCHFRKGATGTVTELTLASQTVGGAHADGGFVAVDGTKMPGVYRLDLSDTIVDTAGTAIVMLKGATNMAPLILELQCVAVNLDDAVRMGLTALPNAAADAAGGLPISDAGGLDLDGVLSGNTPQTGDTFAQLPTNFSDMSIAVTTGRVDVGLWLGTAVTTSATTALPEVDAKSISDNAAAADNVQANIGNLDAPVSTVDTVVDGIQTDLDNATDGLGAIKATADAIETDTQDIQSRLPAALVNSRMDATIDDTGMEAGAVSNILTTQMTEAYAANGVAPTLAQAQFAIHQMLMQFGISGTSLTVRKLDDATTAFVVTLDSASAPTDASRV